MINRSLKVSFFDFVEQEDTVYNFSVDRMCGTAGGTKLLENVLGTEQHSYLNSVCPPCLIMIYNGKKVDQNRPEETTPTNRIWVTYRGRDC